MPKIKKYFPDYAALYPDTPLTCDVLKALRESDQKMKYMEYDLKRERPKKDKTGVVVGLIPSREDSYERLLEVDKQFEGSAPSPEQVFFEQEEIRGLREAVGALDAADRELIEALFFAGQTMQGYAHQIGVSRHVVYRRRQRILAALKKYFKKQEVLPRTCPFPTAK